MTEQTTGAPVPIPTADGATTTADNQETETNVSVGREARQLLRNYVKRIEQLISERSEINDAIREVMAEAKGAGLDAKTIRAVIRLRAIDAATRREQEMLLDLYKSSLGMK